MSPAFVPKVLVLALMMYAAYELVRNPVRFIRAINSVSEAVDQLRSYLFQQAGPLFEPQTLPESPWRRGSGFNRADVPDGSDPGLTSS